MALPLSITLEEHYTSKAHRSSEAGKEDPHNAFPARITDRLAEVGDARVEDMDQNGVSIQVISHSPAPRYTTQSILDSNTELATAVRAHPTRLAGFAQLPMLDPAAAAIELQRCVKELGFVGALIDNHTDGMFYDGTEYEQFWAKAQDLDVPIYIHPAWPSADMNNALYSGGALTDQPRASMALGAFVFGWHASTANTFLRLLAAKTFEKFPRLKIVLGHCGEALPYMFARIDHSTRILELQRSFATVMHENVWITTSGMFDTNPLRCLLGVMPKDRVMFSIDYPFSDNSTGRQYLEAIRDENVLDEVDLKAFAFGNAEKLLFKNGLPK